MTQRPTHLKISCLAAVLMLASLSGDAFAGTFTTGSTSDGTPPQIVASPTARDITGSSAVIAWTTNELADSRVNYGPSTPLASVAGDIEYSLQHGVTLTKLSQNTTYRFQVKTVDPKGNATSSSVFTFTTSGLAEQSISFTGSAPSPTYAVGGSFAISATASSGLPVTYSSQTGTVCSVSGSSTPATVQILSAGMCTIVAAQGGDDDYAAATPVTQSITIAKANQAALVVTATPETLAVGESSQLSASGGSTSATVTFTVISGSCLLNGTQLRGNAAGACSVKATRPGDTDYNAVDSAPIAVTVNAVQSGSQTISFTGSAPSPTYAVGGSFAISATASSGLPVTYSSQTGTVCSVSGSSTPATVQILSAGMCTIVAAQGGDDDYAAATPVTQSITIAKANQAALVVTATPETLAVGESSQLSTMGGSSSGDIAYQLVSGACAISGDQVTANAEGACLITATKLGDTNYNLAVSPVIAVSVISSQAPTPSPGGPVDTSVTGGSVVSGSAQFVPAPTTGANVEFPYGVFTFSATSQPGGTVTVTLTFPEPLPSGTKIMKQIDGAWVDWTSRSTLVGRVLSFSITDGAYGDTNPLAGIISDPIGPAIPTTVGPGPGPIPNPIPTLQSWEILLMIISMFAAFCIRRRIFWGLK